MPRPVVPENAEICRRTLSDGRCAYVVAMTYGKGRLCVSSSDTWTNENEWCYETLPLAVMSLQAWDPLVNAEPEGWMRHPSTGRRRPGGDPAKEYIQQ